MTLLIPSVAVVDDCSYPKHTWLACYIICPSQLLIISISPFFTFSKDSNCLCSCQDSSFLYMGRLLEGFGVGIISYTVNHFFSISFQKQTLYKNYSKSNRRFFEWVTKVPVYIAEIAPQNMRGGLGSVNQVNTIQNCEFVAL